MAETAKILSPGREVLLPDLAAGCSLAESCPAPLFKAFREAHPDHLSITYINCSAEVKALSDIICTSSSALKILEQIPPERPVLFAPDRNLGRYVSKISGRDLLLWQGACIVHEIFSDRKIRDLRFLHPEAKLIAHPECLDAILDQAEYIGSTSALLDYVRKDAAREFIVATEAGIIHQMQKACPEKIFHPAPPDNECACNECPYMKLNTLEKLYLCMRDRAPAIRMEESLRRRALLPIRRMLQLSAGEPGAMEEILREIRFPFTADSLN
jgi:quinolinate synthase